QSTTEPWPEAFAAPVALTDPIMPTATLADALAARRTSRGADLTGPLGSAQLAGLLWTAFGGQVRHRPFPSAGASYRSRVRLGVARGGGGGPGLHHAGGGRRAV